MDLINFIGCSPFSKGTSIVNIYKYDIGGSITNPELIAKKPLKRKQMQRLSNNWENGVQGYQLNGYYYDRNGNPLTKEQYKYYYNEDNSPIDTLHSSISGNINTDITANQDLKDSVNTTSDFISINKMSNGESRTIRNLIVNNQGINPQSYQISYDVNHPNLFFAAQGISTEDAKKLIFNK